MLEYAVHDYLVCSKTLIVPVLRVKQFPVPLGDNIDVATGYFDGGLIVNRVHRNR